MPRGGKREGAGRKANVPSAKTIARLEFAAKAAAGGKSPLDVMVGNMRHFDKLAASAEAALAELSADKVASLPPDEQFKYLLAEVKKTVGLREQSQGCARDAAPYLHSRLSTVEAKHEHSGSVGVRFIVEGAPNAA